MSKSSADKLIWLRPEPGDRAAKLTRAKIAATALAIADAHGFEAVSMRRIAAKLGAGAMTLYHYIRTKTDLLALMDDAIMGEILVPDGELPSDWRKAMAAIARRTRDVFARHPWALLATRGAVPGPNGLRHFEQCLEAVAGAPLTQERKLELLKLVDDFVFGHALRESEVRAWGGTDSALHQAIEEFGRRQLATGSFPRTAALMGKASSQETARHLGWLTDDARFDRALTAILDGTVSGQKPPRRSRKRAR